MRGGGLAWQGDGVMRPSWVRGVVARAAWARARARVAGAVVGAATASWGRARSALVMAASAVYLNVVAAGALGAAAVACRVGELTRGRDVSDVGVAMYEYGGLAFAAALAVHVALVAGLWALLRPLERALPWYAAALAWLVRVLATLLALPVFAFAFA